MRLRYNVLMAIAAGVAFATPAAVASAASRLPQITFNSAALQSRLNTLGESINVRTQQQDEVVWGPTVSSSTTTNILFRQNGTSSCDQIGIARLNVYRSRSPSGLSVSVTTTSAVTGTAGGL